ncbi:hypothetical protein C8Q74DRAFT_530116 [Fomes fomentarius]|nr:hypothetical protein C8Q74DRAFT_530116 [Fomes fomentarius]
MLLPLIFAIIPSILAVSAQNATTNAICLDQYDWMKNTLGQSPCLVAAWLHIPCYPTTGFNQIPVNGSYSAPPPGSIQCACNTVMFSLIAACAWCQGYANGVGMVNWQDWTRSCPNIGDVTESVIFPLPVPNQTVIPDWASTPGPLLMDGRWDENTAFSLAQRAASTTSFFVSTTSDLTTSSSQSGSIAPTATASNTPGSIAPHKNVIGPALGGALGGLVGLLLIGGGVWWYLRRHKLSSLHQSNMDPAPAPQHYGNGSVGPRPQLTQYAKTVLYNPDDPRTYPAPSPFAPSSRAEEHVRACASSDSVTPIRCNGINKAHLWADRGPSTGHELTTTRPILYPGMGLAGESTLLSRRSRRVP